MGSSLNAGQRTDIIQAENVRLHFGAKGDGVTDDTVAFQNAINTGRSVFIPAGSYKITASLQLTSQIGQRIFGSAQELTTVFTQVDDMTLFIYGARSQQIENMTLSGSSLENGGIGISIPFYFPYWRAYSLLMRNFGTAIDNHVPTPPVGQPGYPSGSDAGGVDNCQITSCTKGIRTVGNKDYLHIENTAVGSCLIGLEVAQGGAAVICGNVWGGDGTTFNIIDGAATARGVHIETDSAASGYNGCVFELATNTSLDFHSCLLEKGGDTSVVDIRAASGAQVDFYGRCGGFTNARANGSPAQIRQWGGVPGLVTIDVNGVSSIPAGPYNYGNTLPSPAINWCSRHFALIADGSPAAMDFEEYVCEYIGGAYMWNPVSARRAYLTTSDPHVAGKLWNNLGLATFSGG